MAENPLTVMYHDAYRIDYPTASCETPERIESVIAALREHYPVLEPEPASEEDILRVHTQSILDDVKRDPDLYRAAIMAAGGTIGAAHLAVDGQPAFAAVRPPGHHASPSSHWGFCFFNNVAVAIEKLLAEKRISSALILDIDLHFGDGTDNFFARRKNVEVANIQERDRSRFLEEVDKALGSNDYDIVAISAGFDCHREDWGGVLTTEDYETIGAAVKSYAGAKCSGRRFAVLEGGYNVAVLGDNALALCKGLQQ